MTMTNYYDKIAEMFGVTLGEEFYLKKVKTSTFVGGGGENDFPSIFYFSANGLFTNYNEETNPANISFSCPATLHKLLAGEFEVISIDSLQPFIPEKGQNYFCINEEGKIRHHYFDNDSIDAAYILMGNCFKTKEGAARNKNKIQEKIQKALKGEFSNGRNTKI